MIVNHTPSLNEVRAARANAYPPLGDQIDAIFQFVQAITAHVPGFTMPADVQAWLSNLAAVKAKFPKPTS